MVQDTVALAAIRQQLESDRLLGVSAVPIPQTVLAALSPAVAAPRPVMQQPPLAPASIPQTAPPLRPVTPPVGQVAAPADDEKTRRLSVLDQTQVKSCVKCGLSKTRTRTVFGQGNPNARLVFVGEAPGYDEDQHGLAFVGRAGQLLTKMIFAMGLTRDDVFICNVLKCRPPGNRDPSADEILACSPYLREQLQIIAPEVLVALGSPASKTLLNTAESIGRLRGRFHPYYFSGVTGQGDSVPLMPTYHPAYLLRNETDKKKTWEDLQMVMTHLGLPRPTVRSEA